MAILLASEAHTAPPLRAGQNGAIKVFVGPPAPAQPRVPTIRLPSYNA